MTQGFQLPGPANARTVGDLVPSLADVLLVRCACPPPVVDLYCGECGITPYVVPRDGHRVVGVPDALAAKIVDLARVVAERYRHGSAHFATDGDAETVLAAKLAQMADLAELIAALFGGEVER
ncbi:MAG: hypothetical protein ACKVT1_02415 [Dehalococcoidia bacterium]